MKNFTIFRYDVWKKIILFSAFSGVIVSLYSYVSNSLNKNEGVLHAVIITIGSINIQSSSLIISILVFSLPFILFIACTGDLIYKEYVEKGAIILTRLKSKRKLFIQTTADITILSSLFLGNLFIVSVFMNLVLGYKLKLDYLLETIVLFLLMLLFFITFSLLSNFVCFITKSGLGYVVTISTFILSMFTTAFIYEWFFDYLYIIAWLPTSQMVISWHESFSSLIYTQIGISISICFSFIYLSIALIGSSVALYIIINRYENT